MADSTVVKDLDDAMMLRIMAEENINLSTSPMVIHETVLAVKQYLDYEFAKVDTISDLPKLLINLLAVKNQKGLSSAKKGVGQTIILKFLGGNWKQWMVQDALDTLKDKNIDREAVESFKTMGHARAFKESVRDYQIPKSEQKRFAEQIVKSEEKLTMGKVAETIRKNKQNKKGPSDDSFIEGVSVPAFADTAALSDNQLPSAVVNILPSDPVHFHIGPTKPALRQG